MKRNILVLSCVICMVWGGVGCGKKRQEEHVGKQIEKTLKKHLGKDVKVEISDGKVRVVSADGELNIDGNSVNLVSPEGKVNIAAEKINITGKEGKGKMVAGGAVGSTEFPQGVYQYENAGIVAASSIMGAETFMLETKDKTAVVIKTYKKEMKKLGWKETMFSGTEDGAVIMCRKGKETVQITIAEDDDKTDIVIVVRKEE